MSAIEFYNQKDQRSRAIADLSASRHAVETVSGHSYIVDSNTEMPISSHRKLITCLVTGSRNFAQVAFVAYSEKNDVDENGYSEDKVAFLLSLENADADMEAPDGEEEFLNWLHCD